MAGVHLTAHMVGNQLHAVADAQDRHSGAQRAGIDLRGAGLVDAGWPAAQDHSGWVSPLELRPRRGAGNQFAVDMCLAYAPCDQLTELGSEIENEDCLARRFLQLWTLARGRGC